jgi:hypothetical protein
MHRANSATSPPATLLRQQAGVPGAASKTISLIGFSLPRVAVVTAITAVGEIASTISGMK